MQLEHGYLGKFMEGLQNYISVHYPKLYSDLQDEDKKELEEVKEKAVMVFQEYLDKVK